MVGIFKASIHEDSCVFLDSSVRKQIKTKHKSLGVALFKYLSD